MKESKCLHCKSLIRYNLSQSTGKYCNNKCQQDYKFINETIPRVEGGMVSQPKTLKRFVIDRDGEVCSKCGLENEWQDEFLSIQIDHIDGNRQNNMPDNLRLLCPNCHSQTETHSGRNHKRKGQRISDNILLAMLKKSDSIAKALGNLGLPKTGRIYERCYRLLEGS